MARYVKFYKEVVRPMMLSQYNYTNPLLIPELKSITLSFYMNNLEDEEDWRIVASLRILSIVSGQVPSVTQSGWSGMGGRERRYIFACNVHLRGDRAYKFLEYLVHVVFPLQCRRNGWPAIQLTRHGEYTTYFKDLGVFFRNNENLIEFGGHMVCQIETTAASKEEGASLLRKLGVPVHGHGMRETPIVLEQEYMTEEQIEKVEEALEGGETLVWYKCLGICKGCKNECEIIGK
jgi:ribosomal protein L5